MFHIISKVYISVQYKTIYSFVQTPSSDWYNHRFISIYISRHKMRKLTMAVNVPGITLTFINMTIY